MGPDFNSYSANGVSSIYLFITYSFVNDYLFPFSPKHSDVF